MALDNGQYFRDWEALTPFLAEALPVLEADRLARESALCADDENAGN